MNILILTGKFGMGHWSAARALQEQLKGDGHQVETVDLFDYAMPELAPAIYRGFSLLVTYGGRFYNQFYNLGYRLTANGDGRNGLAWPLMGRLGKLLNSRQPELVICTDWTCAATMSRYKEEYSSAIPMVTCVTDVSCHSGWLHHGTDCYLVAEEGVRQGMIDKGVDPWRIAVTGIPVSGRFRPAARRTGDRRELLIMGGGLGLMPRRDSFYQRLNDMPNAHTVILTGRNERLYQQLWGRYENIEAVPFTDRVPDYMAKADLMLSKTGGITSFEAIAARLPLLAWEPHLKQEQENASFMVERGMARIAVKEEGACLDAIRALLYDDVALAGMERAMDEMAATFQRTAVSAVVRELAEKAVCA